MGDPLSPTVADLVMEDLMDYAVSRLNFSSPVIRKFVDDLILTVPRDQIENVISIFNSYSPHLQFTHEKEQDNRIPFLDMTIIRLSDQSIRTEWYIKPIASGRFLDFKSFHPFQQKINMITSFIHRVKQLSTALTDDQIKQIIDKQLQLNHYPASLRHRFLNRMNERAITTDESCPTQDQTNSEKQYRRMPYIPFLTDKISKHLGKDYPNIVIAAKNIKTNRELYTRLKEKVPTELRSNIIYQIPCTNCSSSYIGMTSNYLKTRLSGHKSNINALNRLTERQVPPDDPTLENLKEKTALIKHSAETGHKFALDKTNILDHHVNTRALAILESCHILNHETINKRSDTDNLSSSYAGILQTLKTINTKIRRDTVTNTTTSNVP
ncbi:uncharacterized protein LOC134291093 [Aedes albopictus]|uniref:Helix-turn-helix domain-containing protein n=1 Tax=Aedes albopictus TaxID=7160 RepID=A0ABM1YSS7_AEDAL